MKKLEGRALMCIALAAALIIGLGIFIGKLVIHGDDWATFYANTHVYNQGRLAVGTVYDRKRRDTFGKRRGRASLQR